MTLNWQSVSSISSREFRCGFCGFHVASDKGFFASSNGAARIYICPHCGQPSYFNAAQQVPGVVPGNDVSHLPQPLDSLYKEARNCCGVSAFTSSVLASR